MANDAFRVKTIQDILEMEAVPLEDRFEEKNTYELLRNAAAFHGDKIAISFLPTGSAHDTPVQVTYRELFKKVTQTANMLNDLGVDGDKAVSFLLPNLPETHYVIWGGEAAGIVNAINPLLEPRQIADIMKAANSRVLVALAPLPETEIWDKALAVKEMVPEIKTLVQVMGPGDEAQGILPFTQTMEKYPGDRLMSGRQIKPDDIASYFHTGGTTGAPKLAQHTHYSVVFEAWTMGAMMGTTPDDALICGLPLFHVNAVIVTGLSPFMFGASVVIPSPAGYRTPKVIQEFWQIAARYKATFFSAVPTVYSALLNVPVGNADISSMRNAICGAAPMPVEVIKAFEETTSINIQEGYGLTEGTCASCVNPSHGERRTGSIGFRFPYQDMKAVIVDDKGKYVRDCEVDEVGVIAIHGPNVFPGYKQKKHNKNIWVKEGWLNTGDLGREDAEGYFWLTGRAKDLIIRGGHNIDPAHIEEALHEHPAVELAAAVGKPDSYAGEIPVAYVSLKPGARTTATELLQYAKENISERAAIPANIFLLDSMPVTAVGKIFKPTLRHYAIQQVFEELLRPLSTGEAEIKVKVGSHETKGTLATIQVTGKREKVEAQIQEEVGKFAIPFEIVGM